MTTTMRDTTEILARQHRFAARVPENAKTPPFWGGVFVLSKGSLTITYFHTGNPHYHRRGVVSRSCSGWEGVGPT
ncbi:hypothetical protein, partial [Caballeronia sp. BCC1704]|uniref:hypothetical protein n=1 Tax=Caballeronia sp. BCC1704 TaxID=2676300 RepID=UPI001ABB8F8F